MHITFYINFRNLGVELYKSIMNHFKLTYNAPKIQRRKQIINELSRYARVNLHYNLKIIYINFYISYVNTIQLDNKNALFLIRKEIKYRF